ncbi:MAG TPA: exosortase/archaeosortase family protein [Pyrinomonadaceae bacterium]|nr:exosortase/archaeosortase family protein [Pyrinomonadaceae bacterium]
MSAIPQKFYQPVAIAVAIGFVYFSVLVKLGNDWWHDENYSHGLLIPFLIAFILWQERKQLRDSLGEPWTRAGAAGIALSLGMLWAGTAGAELFVQRMSLVLMLVSVVIYFFGARLLRWLAVPVVLLLLSIPIPQIIFNRVAFPLQLFASRCAVSAMWLFNIPVLRQGNVMELMPRGAVEPKRLAVVEACSGIRSLMTLVTLAVIYAYFTGPRAPQPSAGDDHQKPKSKFGAMLLSITFWRSLVLIVSAVPIAILTNAVRVSGTGVLSHYYGTRVADGFFHSFSGWVIYIAAALLLFATAWVFDRIVPFLKKIFGSGLPPAWPGGTPALNEFELSK